MLPLLTNSMSCEKNILRSSTAGEGRKRGEGWLSGCLHLSLKTDLSLVLETHMVERGDLTLAGYRLASICMNERTHKMTKILKKKRDRE